MASHARSRHDYKIKHLALLVSLAIPMMARAQDSGTADVSLPTIQVQAQVMGETTEGTGSYTTGRSGTATPLGMSLRDTPQSVSVVTQQRIEDQQLQSITDVVNNVTGVSVNQYETHRAQLNARGFDINNLQIDGVPTTWDQSWSAGEVLTSLAPYDRVEVVRGATGLMTGAGDPSAALNLVHKRADSKEFTGSAEVGVGSWNQRRALIDLSSPLNKAGTVRARVVGEHTEGDSWVSQLENKSDTLYATLEADLTPDTLLSIGASRQETDPRGPMWGGLPYWYTDGSKTNWSRSKTSAADWTRWNTVYENYFAKLEHRFGNDWKLRASYSHGNRVADSYLLYLSGIPDRTSGLGMGGFAGSYHTRTEQDDIGVQASGPFQFAGRKHEAAFGYIHSEQKFDSQSRAADFGGAVPAVGDFNAWDGTAYPEPTWGAPSFYETSTTKQDAVYGVVRLSIADPLRAILGTRITNYEKTGNSVYAPAYSLKHEREVTPYAGLVYDLNDTYSLYASYTDIFKPQNNRDVNGNNLDPIVGKSTEAGIKGEFLGGRLNASFAVFRIKQDNLAQEAGVNPSTMEIYYRSAEGATSDGFEFDIGGELARNWNVSAGYSQFKATDAAGEDVNSVYPRKLFRLFTTYRLPGSWNALTVGGGANWQSRTYSIDPGAPASTDGRIEQKPFWLVNLMARYDFNTRLSAQLNINNVLDEKYFSMFAAYGAITYGAPRNATLTLKYRF